MRADVDYDALVKKLERQQEEEKALKERIKAAESEKLTVFTKIFEKSYKGDFKQLILKADKRVLQKAAESIVAEFEKHLEVAENDLNVGDPIMDEKDQKPKKKSVPKVQKSEELDVQKMFDTVQNANPVVVNNVPEPPKSTQTVATKIVEDLQKSDNGITYSPMNNQ